MLKRLCIRHVAIVALFCGSLLAATDSRANSLSVGLNGISDWSTQHPFLDLMKTARPWIGHLSGQWGGVSFEDLMERGALNAQGWPVTVPAEVAALESLVLTDQPEEAAHLRGQYHVFFDGRGRFELTGRARVIRREDGHHVFDYTPGSGAVGLKIAATEASDPIRNIRIIKDEHLEMFEAGAVFNPVWLQRLEGFDTLRFMDWMMTNNSAIRFWKDMPAATDFSYAWRGVPVSKMIGLANELDVDPWFNIPHLADDAMVDRFAREVGAQLEPGRVAHVEYSNEVWNFIFDQARWAQEQAEARWGDLGDGWMQFYGQRAAQVMDIWSGAFGTSSEGRLTRVVAVHTGWPGLEEGILRGEQVREALGRDPMESFDAYAVSGYFGHEFSDPTASNALLDRDEERVREAGVAKGLSRVALREYVRENRYTDVFTEAAQVVREGSLKTLTAETWPYHAEVARANSLELLMYEGGTHAAANWDAVEDERLVEFLTAFSYSPEIEALYTDLLTAWSEVGGTSFNVFVDVAPSSQWGSWGALRHLDDDNPRWDALQRHMTGSED